MSELFLELYSDPRFVQLIQTILKQRPAIPEHDVQTDNTELWKARSAERRGFDLWVTYLNIPEELKHVR